MTSWENRSEKAVEPKKRKESPADRRSFSSMGWRYNARPCSADTEALLDEVCAAFDNTVDTVISVDISRRIRTINHPPDGMSITDVLGVDVVSYVNPAYQGMVRTMIGDVFASGEPGCYEIQDNGSEDAESWNETRLIPFGENTASRRALPKSLQNLITTKAQLTAKFNRRSPLLRADSTRLMDIFHPNKGHKRPQGWDSYTRYQQKLSLGGNQVEKLNMLLFGRHFCSLLK